VFKKMEDWPADDRRPMVVVAHTVKGWWPGAAEGQVEGTKQVIGYPSHPYAFGMNSEYFRALAGSFERRYGVKFQGIHDGAPKSERDRLIQFKTNVDIAMSVLKQYVRRRRTPHTHHRTLLSRRYLRPCLQEGSGQVDRRQAAQHRRHPASEPQADHSRRHRSLHR
jgi:hypothetical protein